jgi:chromosome segregation protein
LVQVNEPFSAFVRRLLGGTWVVKTLADAISLHSKSLGKVRFVTLDGEIVEPDGTVIVGPKAAATGLVSRRSELRMLFRDVSDLQQKNDELAQQRDDAMRLEQQSESAVQSLIQDNSNLAAVLAEKAARAAEADNQVRDLQQRLDSARGQMADAARELDTVSQKYRRDQSGLQESEARLAGLSSMLEVCDVRQADLTEQRTFVDQQINQIRVDLARQEQHHQLVLESNQQLSLDEASREDELQNALRQLTGDREAQLAAESEIESAERQVADYAAEKQRFEQQIGEVAAKVASLQTQRKDILQRLHAEREELGRIHDKLHQLELKSEQLKLERNQLASRLMEDYRIDLELAQQEWDAEAEHEERQKIDDEITDLRRKIAAIGSVNMDALAELEALEQRYTTMDQQYQDLVQAKETLENIISRINSDSRRLFLETLNAIRENFQRLFRQTFGGGRAELVLEEGVDPLEAGIEIIATPPGKPEFNNSLLSGGERALTAVSLLMAIFQFRPSPYCILDEVDAPFDEANIGRFIDVLRSFLGWTKFVIVTHSKKTMTAATTLYGVTMQESGVSKRVSVRFEDVGDDGRISEDAIRRDFDQHELGQGGLPPIERSQRAVG